MLNAGYLFRLIFKIALAAYFISHGLNLTKNLASNTTLANKNAS